MARETLCRCVGQHGHQNPIGSGVEVADGTDLPTPRTSWILVVDGHGQPFGVTGPANGPATAPREMHMGNPQTVCILLDSTFTTTVYPVSNAHRFHWQLVTQTAEEVLL